MTNIWSKNKYVDILINVLLFMTGINFMHYGQLILPVICLILFIDNKLRFKVNNPKVFILLCLFGISFYAFSHQMGFYSVMGFTLPMAYYIGCNMNKCDEKSIKYIVYLFAISMALHIILNMGYELSIRGLRKLFNSSSHYDFWTRDKMSTTVTATNLMFLIGCSYYLVFYEKNKPIKYISLSLFAITMGYCLIIGRRTSVLAFVLVFVFSFVFDQIHSKQKTNIRKRILYFLLFVGLVVLFFGVLYILKEKGIRTIFDNVYIFYKFSQSIFDENRFHLYRLFIEQMPNYLLGGQKISEIIGLQIHELWLDVYDYAGIVTYILLLIYTYFYVKDIYRLYRSRISVEYKTLFLSIFIVIAIQMFLEPVMTAASLFLLIAIIYGSAIGKMNDR